MGKNPGIRITQNDRAEYARLVKNTKAKVRNTVKNYGPIVHDVSRNENGELTLTTLDIRSKLKIPSLDSFQTRKEFNEWKEDTKKFNSGKSPHSKFIKNQNGMVFTEYFKTVGQNMEYQIERNREREYKKTKDIEIKDKKGKTIGTVGSEMQKMMHPEAPGFQKPFIFDMNNFYSPSQLKRWFETGEAKRSPEWYQDKKETMQQNWIEMIKFNYNSEADELIKHLEAMSPDDFYEFYMMNKSKKWINFDYIPSPQKEAGGYREGGILEFTDMDANALREIESDFVKYQLNKNDNPLKHPNFD